MKKQLATLAVCFLTFGSFAKIRIVDNNGSNPGNYTSLQKAIDDSNMGDTVYVVPSNNTYGRATITKKIILIGGGHNRSFQSTKISQIDYVVFDTLVQTIGSITTGVSGSSGSKIMGFKISDQITVETARSIYIQDNYINLHYQMNLRDNCTLINNIIIAGACDYTNCGPYRQINFNNSNNILVSNNVISQVYIGNSINNTVLFQNNLILGSNDFINTYYVNGISNMIFSNNIFAYSYPNNCESCTFNNNLIYANTENNLPYGNNIGTNNIINQVPKFINLPINEFNFSYSYDYHLQSNSPGINSGLDGSQIGIFGGMYKMKTENGIISGNSLLPILSEFNVLNPVPANSIINVNLKAKSQN